MSPTLEKTLGPARGAAVLMTIVIGAGLLTLPGLAAQAAGDQAPLAWALCALASLPLLAVFIVLGRRQPEAGGVAAYARRAFGPFGARMAGYLFLGAVIFGLPSIALTGGHYIASQLGGSAHLHAFILLGLAVTPHLLPGEGAAKVMSIVASTVLLAIVAFLIAGAIGIKDQQAAGGDATAHMDWALAFAPFMMLFFAFTGWEIGAGLAEEFKRPDRDYPIAMIASFSLATALYLAIAWVVSRTNLAGAYEAPFVAIVRPVLGQTGAAAVAATAALIITANLAGAVWGVSRMVYGLAREGELPSALTRMRGGRPLVAVAATFLALAFVLAADGFHGFGLKTLLSLAGQNFLILYGVAAAALIAMARAPLDQALGALALVIVIALIAMQGVMIAYPLALVALAACVGALGGADRVLAKS